MSGSDEEAPRSRSKAFWNAHAERDPWVAIYDHRETRDPRTRAAAFERTGKEDAELLAGHVHPGMTVLDLGCGMGRVMKHVAPLCARIIGVDVSESMIEMARGHLATLDNATLTVTDGRSLRGVETGSVDFLYSLLCLIHVDKRSAYAYFTEAARVLRPASLAFFQFQNILSTRGLAKFKEVLGSDYPLEFYSEPELRWLLEDAGLATLSCVADNEYLFVSAFSGRLEEWRSSLRALTVTPRELSGVFSGGESALRDGSVRVAVHWPGPRYLPLTAVLSAVCQEDGRSRQVLAVRAPACMAEGEGAELRFEVALTSSSLVGRVLRGEDEIAREESRLERSGSGGTIVFTLGLLPAGFALDAESLREFPELFSSFAATLGA